MSGTAFFSVSVWPKVENAVSMNITQYASIGLLSSATRAIALTARAARTVKIGVA
jgi:hypothetical protein